MVTTAKMNGVPQKQKDPQKVLTEKARQFNEITLALRFLCFCRAKRASGPLADFDG